jgi:hypothetical protein
MEVWKTERGEQDDEDSTRALEEEPVSPVDDGGSSPGRVLEDGPESIVDDGRSSPGQVVEDVPKSTMDTKAFWISQTSSEHDAKLAKSLNT